MAIQVKDMNSKIAWKDIKKITIIGDDTDVDGWVVQLTYKDDKHAAFSIDYGDKNEDMLSLVFKCIRRQMKGGDSII